MAPFKLLSAYSEIFSQYDEIIQYLAEGKTRVVDYSFQVLIYGDSKEEIEETLKIIRLSLKISGIEIVRETENLENAFFSQMIGYQKLNHFREIPICTHSLASFSSLSSVSEGLKSCTWGNEPVCQLQTRAQDIEDLTHDFAKAETLAQKQTVENEILLKILEQMQAMAQLQAEMNRVILAEKAKALKKLDHKQWGMRDWQDHYIKGGGDSRNNLTQEELKAEKNFGF
ncbi:MAG: hypothetical protein GY793_04240 [Proteobacteria bacterium]|nr:hypothetical protein [Pseudomonadota bacterium]